VQRTVGVRSVGEGLRMVWRDVPLRLCFIYWGTVSLFIGGSMQVAIPVLARVLHGASTLGLLLGATVPARCSAWARGRHRRASALRQLRRHDIADRCAGRRAGNGWAPPTMPGWPAPC
jgi:hypothetical protein